MKTFWVLGYDNYYPGYDNFEASFDNQEDAESYIARINMIRERRRNDDIRDEDGDFQIFDHYMVIDISDRL